jgi:hypothetical protein
MAGLFVCASHLAGLYAKATLSNLVGIGGIDNGSHPSQTYPNSRTVSKGRSPELLGVPDAYTTPLCNRRSPTVKAPSAVARRPMDQPMRFLRRYDGTCRVTRLADYE